MCLKYRYDEFLVVRLVSMFLQCIMYELPKIYRNTIGKPTYRGKRQKGNEKKRHNERVFGYCLIITAGSCMNLTMGDKMITWRVCLLLKNHKLSATPIERLTVHAFF